MAGVPICRWLCNRQLWLFCGSWIAGILTKDGRDGTQEVEGTKAKRAAQSLDLREVGVQEDLRRVVRNDIDTTELLHEHGDLRGDHGVAVAADKEDLLEPALLDGRPGFILGLDSYVHIEEITGGLELVVAHSADRLVGIGVAVLGHVPAGAFRVERDHAADDDGGDSCAGHHQAPVQADRDAVVMNLEVKVSVVVTVEGHVPRLEMLTLNSARQIA